MKRKWTKTKTKTTTKIRGMNEVQTPRARICLATAYVRVCVCLCALTRLHYTIHLQWIMLKRLSFFLFSLFGEIKGETKILTTFNAINGRSRDVAFIHFNLSISLSVANNIAQRSTLSVLHSPIKNCWRQQNVVQPRK